MIRFVTTASHTDTLAAVVDLHGRRRCQVWRYESLFHRKSLPTGTWIFTDHERLSPFELALAGQIASQLAAAGALILNHPARVLSRVETLRRLWQTGINDFSVFRADAGPRPALFPVFVRNAFDHAGRRVALLADQAALEAELQRCEEAGDPLAGKIVIEYAGEEAAPGLWRRFGTYRVGGRLIAHHQAVDTQWIVKDGMRAAAFAVHPLRARFLETERDFVMENRQAATLLKAFEIARIDYGRADFAIVDGRPQIYEINTNPNHASRDALYGGIDSGRLAIQTFSEAALQEAILATDSPATGKVRLRGRMLQRQQRLARRLTGILRRP